MFFLPETPRYYYAKNRRAEGDDMLERLNDAAVESEQVQGINREIMMAIDAGQAASNLRWKLLLTSGIVDTTRMKITRRLCV